MLLDNFYTILSSESSDSTIWTIQVKLNPGHPVYQGHFPDVYKRQIWMSQFLDCFSEEEVTSILTRAARSMSGESRLYIMETFWNRQKFDTAAYCLTQISLYFTAMANGNSKMYHSDDMERCIKAAGLEVEKIDDHLGMGHSIVQCRWK